jgi:Polyketide cyclase / dehydrase and lipid transport
MAPITTSTEVNRPAEEVFADVTDPTRFVEWQQGVVNGQMEDDGPHGVGARCLTTRRIGGAERSVTSEITHIDPPRTWGVRAIDGPIRAIVNVTVSPLDEGRRSRVAIDLDLTGHGIGKLLVPLFVRSGVRKEMPASLARLKERLESLHELASTSEGPVPRG